MILPNPKDALHRSRMYQLLAEIADNQYLATNMVFKGGTCAALINKLDRFSVDLDFDLKTESDNLKISNQLEKIFADLSLKIDGRSSKAVQYVLKYEAPISLRNTLKLDAIYRESTEDEYVPVFLPDLDRYLVCQTIETMFAHKLVAITDRYNKHKTVAGRDIYDIHYFFINNYQFSKKIVQARTGKTAEEYLKYLVEFVKQNVDQDLLNEDLNTLLSPEQFQQIRKTLKQEILNMLKF
jgi:predicted nucleotidyltransferase component of viral defense system